MKTNDFDKLDQKVQLALIMAMHVRNEMEDFHIRHLSDEQMKELNPIIRQAIYDILIYLEIAYHSDNQDLKNAAIRILEYQKFLIPDYWELPNEEAPRTILRELI